MKWNEVMGIIGIVLFFIGIIMILGWTGTLIIKSVAIFLTSNFFYPVIVGMILTVVGILLIWRI